MSETRSSAFRSKLIFGSSPNHILPIMRAGTIILVGEVETVTEVVDGPGGSERVGNTFLGVSEQVDFWVFP